MTEDLAWNIGGARNLAVHLAATAAVLLLDVDALLPAEVAGAIVGLPLRSASAAPLAHRFNRKHRTAHVQQRRGHAERGSGV